MEFISKLVDNECINSLKYCEISWFFYCGSSTMFLQAKLSITQLTYNCVSNYKVCDSKISDRKNEEVHNYSRHISVSVTRQTTIFS